MLFCVCDLFNLSTALQFGLTLAGRCPLEGERLRPLLAFERERAFFCALQGFVGISACVLGVRWWHAELSRALLSLPAACCRFFHPNVQNIPVRGRWEGTSTRMFCCLKFATWGFLGQWRYKRRLDASFASSRCPEPSYFAHWSSIFDKMACDLVISEGSVAVRLDPCWQVPLLTKGGVICQQTTGALSLFTVCAPLQDIVRSGILYR